VLELVPRFFVLFDLEDRQTSLPIGGNNQSFDAGNFHSICVYCKMPKKGCKSPTQVMRGKSAVNPVLL
jgi:hypothetical protein